MARVECPYCSQPAMTAMEKVFLFRARKCEHCGEKVTAPRAAAMLFGPIAIVMFLSGWDILYGGPVVSSFVNISLLAVAYFIYIMWVPLVPKEEPSEWGEERLWQLMQGFFMVIGSAFIAAPLWFLLTHDFRTERPTDTENVPNHTNRVTTLAWSPDGKRLASGARGNSGEYAIKLWDVSSGQLLRKMQDERRRRKRISCVES